MWTVVYRAKNGWDVFRKYSHYYSALRWIEYNREHKGWVAIYIGRET